MNIRSAAGHIAQQSTSLAPPAPNSDSVVMIKNSWYNKLCLVDKKSLAWCREAFADEFCEVKITGLIHLAPGCTIPILSDASLEGSDGEPLFVAYVYITDPAQHNRST